jgi:CRISPR-associated endoribonuclease Cas6
MIDNLPVQRILLTLRHLRPDADPRSLFRLRTLYQDALAAVSPCHGETACTAPITCPYHVLFAQDIPPDPELARRHQKPPHPFAWLLPSPGQLVNGSTVSCSLVLIGRAAAQLSSQLRAVARLFHDTAPVGYTLELLSIAGLAGEVVALPNSGQSELPALPLVTWGDLVREAGEAPSVLTIEAVTPLRLMLAGRQAVEFDPALFLRQVIRRCSALADCYGEELLALDFRGLAEQTRQVSLLEQDLRWQGSGTPFAGLAGNATLTGDLRDFWPWLVLGQWVNVGKGAAFGMGRYRLVW